MFRKFLFLLILIPLGLFRGDNTVIDAQESPDLHVVVNMVQLNVAVTDKNGNYITGLRPKDFTIIEDGITEKAATFAEGDEPAHGLSESAESERSSPSSNLTRRSSAGGALSS